MKKQTIVLSVILSFWYTNILFSQTISLRGIATGSEYSIIYIPVNNIDYRHEIDSVLKQVDYNFSLYDKKSLLSQVNNQNSAIILSDDFIELFRKSENISKKTQGAFNITVDPLIHLWKAKFKMGILADSSSVDSVLKFIGYQNVHLKEKKMHIKDNRITLDFNAIAQGFAVDKVRKFLHSKRITNFIIDVGGEVFANGLKPNGNPWIVGIEKPSKEAIDSKELLFTVPIINKAIATSGNYRKFTEINGKRYSHIINPISGYPLHGQLISVSVVANDCSTADGYATAFMVLGMEASEKIIKKNHRVSACFIYYDNNGILKIKKTKGFPSHISKSKS